MLDMMTYLWFLVENIFLLEFNPYSFIEHGERQNPDLQTRSPALEDAILKQVDRVKNYENKEPVEVVHLLYDQ